MHLPPPCWQRDEWTRETNHGATVKTPEQLVEDRFAVAKAQLICYTKCPMREQCLEKAFAFEGPDAATEDRFNVWGGWKNRERADVQHKGRQLTAPASIGKHRINWKVVDRVALLNETAQEVGAEFNVSPKALTDKIKMWVWIMRTDLGEARHVTDESSVGDLLHDGNLALATETNEETSHGSPTTVRAA